jgi:hypothetical protein
MVLSEEELQQVVASLHEEPFAKKNFRIVDLDKKPPLEWTALLYEICSSIDDSFDENVNVVRADDANTKEERATLLLQVLNVLKYPNIPKIKSESSTTKATTALDLSMSSGSSSLPVVDESKEGNDNDTNGERIGSNSQGGEITSTTPIITREEWANRLVNGVKETVLPVISWLLQHRDGLCERAYLAKYLMPLKVPLPLDSNVNTSRDSLESATSTIATRPIMSSRGGSTSVAPSAFRGDMSTIRGGIVSSRHHTGGMSSRGGMSAFGGAQSTRAGMSSRGEGGGGISRKKNHPHDSHLELMDLVNKYTEMQEDFADIHKEFKQKLMLNQNKSSTHSSSLKQAQATTISIVDLENRKVQLEHRIQQLERNHMDGTSASSSSGGDALEAMIEACSSSRQAHAEHTKLVDQVGDQEHMLELAHTTFSELNARGEALNKLQEQASASSSSDDRESDSASLLLLEHLASAVQDKKSFLKEEIIKEMLEQQQELKTLDEEAHKPAPRSEDLDGIQEDIVACEENVAYLNDTNNAKLAQDNNSKQQLDIFRQVRITRPLFLSLITLYSHSFILC